MQNSQPLVVAYGVGVDSTAVLVGLKQRGIVPDLILFADVGAERQATYDFLPVINEWLRSVDFPQVTVCRYNPSNFKHWPPYHTIEENILTNTALPSIAYGTHKCSEKWKIKAQEIMLRLWGPAVAAWKAGLKVRRLVGFEASPKELLRSKRCATFAVKKTNAKRYITEFPLQEWGWDRARCIQEIMKEGLPVPSKSSCYFCTAMKPWEVDELPTDKLMRLVIIEARTRDQHLEYARKRGWPKGVGVPMTAGIWRKAVKGCYASGKPNGAEKKPGSMTEYIREKGLLDGPIIDALIANTPTKKFTAADFAAEGVANWQDWLNKLCNRAYAQAYQQLSA